MTKTIGDSSFFNEVCYTGGIYDVSTGLYYLNARYYNPNNRRFITHDTYRGELNDPDILHLYAYCSNNPINYTDTSGHLKQTMFNKVSNVAMVIDVIIMGIGLRATFKSARALHNYLMKNRGRVLTIRMIKKLKRCLVQQ